MLANSVINLQNTFENNFTMGFDINILIDALEKTHQKTELSILELHSINKAKSFFETITDFCDGKHKVYFTGISGSEAFSLYVSSTKLVGSVEDIKNSIIPYIQSLETVENSESISATEVTSLISVFKNISQHIHQNNNYGFRNQTVGWRL
ncbi:hypothetical protein [Bacillus cereus]|uniref:hypothetical protein n=1 Tax=Bacillus cereus TaxID=1396 RepID=UPI001427D869|nr:hypothetical protein [Bacillus cereus]NIL13283.1 hypothetical protein [Bacillus cereus]NKW75895.1 hypothetical protein [Bacillus cereus]HDR6477508.1 hypothetical protein [Bacillus cereus]HDR8132913.1 hypothetical protein [Bacillus cereus]